MKPCAQIHIPRTAGRSVRQTLGLERMDEKKLFIGFLEKSEEFFSYSTGHILLTSIPHFQYFINNHLLFTFVRNPYDRFVSLYLMFGKHRTVKKHRKKQELPTFKEFCILTKRLFEENKIPPVGPYIQSPDGLSPMNCQSDWIWDSNNFTYIEFIGRFENLQKDFNMLCRLSGRKPKKLEYVHEKREGRKPYTEYYVAESKHIVYNLYKKDFEMLEYSKDVFSLG